MGGGQGNHDQEKISRREVSLLINLGLIVHFGNKWFLRPVSDKISKLDRPIFLSLAIHALPALL